MLKFKKYIVEFNVNPLKEKEVKEPPKKKGADKDEETSIGSWVKVAGGWIVKFSINDKHYVVSFSALDSAEMHYNFTYYVKGLRTSSHIDKFGVEDEWKLIWESLIQILKDFEKTFHPQTIKFIGMSASKRTSHYKKLFKLYMEEFVNAFKKLGYFSSFDLRDLSQAPTYIIKKGKVKEEENETKRA